jgi:oxalate decarboxylase
LGALKDIAGVNMRLNAGGVRELPWHKAAESSAFRLDRMLRHQSMTEALGYLRRAVNLVGCAQLRFLEVFRSSYFADVSLNQWVALTPHELVEPIQTSTNMSALRQEKAPVVPACSCDSNECSMSRNLAASAGDAQ